jgi:hypothetical protein
MTFRAYASALSTRRSRRHARWVRARADCNQVLGKVLVAGEQEGPRATSEGVLARTKSS